MFRDVMNHAAKVRQSPETCVTQFTGFFTNFTENRDFSHNCICTVLPQKKVAPVGAVYSIYFRLSRGLFTRYRRKNKNQLKLRKIWMYQKLVVSLQYVSLI